MVLNCFLGFSLFSQSSCFTVSTAFNYNSHSYRIVKENKTWANAASCAVSDGGYLVEINDASEQAAVYNGILAAGVSSVYTSVGDGGGIAYVWIGATDKQTEGTWLWDGNNDNAGINFWNGQGQAGAGTGVAIGGNYNNWGKANGTGAIQEPDDYSSNQDAAAIALAGWPSGTNMLGAAGQWNDININNSVFFVIEYNSTLNVPKSTTPERLSVTQNSVNNTLVILSTESDFFASIISLEGKEEFSSHSNSSQLILDLSKYSSGIYLFKYSDNTGLIEYKKLIIK